MAEERESLSGDSDGDSENSKIRWCEEGREYGGRQGHAVSKS